MSTGQHHCSRLGRIRCGLGKLSPSSKQDITNTKCVQDTSGPAGQDVFIASNGAFGFSQAHGVYYPDGAIEGPFNATFNTIGGILGQFTYGGNGSMVWLACPIAEEGPWQVFAAINGLKDGDVPGGCVDECIGFDALTVEYISTTRAAFEYE